MTRIPLSTINAAISAIDQITEGACLNGMEQALLLDAKELIEKTTRYPLTFKIEVF